MKDALHKRHLEQIGALRVVFEMQISAWNSQQ
jgi:hypothetical protein